MEIADTGNTIPNTRSAVLLMSVTDQSDSRGQLCEQESLSFTDLGGSAEICSMVKWYIWNLNTCLAKYIQCNENCANHIHKVLLILMVTSVEIHVPPPLSI